MATSIRLCGELALELDGRDVAREVPAGQAASVLRYLLVHRSGSVDRDRLVEVVWPDGPPKDPRAHLRPILARLRRALDPAGIAGGERLRLTLPEPVWCDVDAAARAVEAARDAARSSAWEDALRQSRAALELLRPGFLPGEDGDWAAGRRSEVEELEVEALEWAARSELALGGARLPAAEASARELVAQAPFRETGHRLLMEALAATGNAAEALRVYDDLRVLLRDELGTAPAAEVQALHQRLLAGRPATSASVPLPARLSPRERGAFVGRDGELARLREAWRDARDGRRRLVLLCGEPGIGKTRLTSELAVAAHADGSVLYAGCHEDAVVSYQPFVEALRHFVRGRPSDAWVEGPGAAELGRLIPELAPAVAPAPSTDEPETRRYLMFDAVSSLLTRAAAHRPLLLVLDDLHWADRPTVQLLRHVVRAQDEAAVLVVGTYREAEVGRDHPLSELLGDLRRDRLFERIALKGLDEEAVGELMGNEAPSALVRTVHEETAGNPFFVEEVLRHLIETGAVLEREGRWTSTVDELGVPDGVKEVLERRLSRLSEACRALLAHAAVLGREFPFDLVREMAGLGEEAAIAALEEALRAQLVVETATAYAFTHALVRETLYGDLSTPRRQRLHARAAAALEGTDVVAALAVHHRLAGPAGDPGKAIEFSRLAGERARELFAWEETAAHWDGALAVMERVGGDPAERAGLLVALAEVMAVVGDLGRQIGYLERALAAYERLGDEERTAQVHSRLGMAHSLIDSIFAEHMDIRRAFRHYDAAREVLDRGPVRGARGHLETGVATAFTYGLDVAEGLAAARRGMEIGERLGDHALWAGAAEAYGWHQVVAGELAEGFEFMERGFEAADRGRRALLAWMATTMRGHMTWSLGDPDAAQPFFERAIGLAYAGKTSFQQQNADGLGRCHASRGEMDEAHRLLADAKPSWVTHSLQPVVNLWDGEWSRVAALAQHVLDTSRQTGNRWDEWASQHLAARVAALRGERERAAELLEAALRIVCDGGARYFELLVRADLARVRAETGRLHDAREHVARCREIVDGGEDWRARRGTATLSGAVVLSRADRAGEAEVAFADAVATFRRYRLPGDEADALHQWGIALARAGDATGAAERLEAALDLYRRHGAGRPWLERVSGDAVR